MAISPDDSDSRLRARISLSPSYASAQQSTTDAMVAKANADVAAALAASAPVTPQPSSNFTYGATSAPSYTAPASTVPQTRVEANEARKAAGPPYPAPAGTHWTWIGTEYKLYKDMGLPTQTNDGAASAASAGGSSSATGTDTTLPSTKVPTGPTLAIDTFKNTLALFFGQAEMSKPWVDGLYKSVSSFYRTGSTVEESFNLALQASRSDANMKPFTDRFKGIYAIQDMKAKGSAIEVPTIAEYFATEAKMGDMLRSTGLGTLANEPFLGDVIGKGVSATEFSNRISAVFDRIDQAPAEIKRTFARYFPTVDRVQLATALLGGEKTAKELESKLQGYEVLAAAETQGIGADTLKGGITEDIAGSLAAGGATYASTIGAFGQVAQARETEQKLAEISKKQALGVTGLTSAVLGKKAKELTALEELTQQEEGRFKGKAGIATLASSRRAQMF